MGGVDVAEEEWGMTFIDLILIWLIFQRNVKQIYYNSSSS
jgi:hypothetical protein